jgi:hypothetical protein
MPVFTGMTVKALLQSFPELSEAQVMICYNDLLLVTYDL